MGRSRYILFKIGQTVFMLWAILTFLFFLFRSMPGSFADQLLFSGADPETVAALKAKWGLNKPIWIQYINYLGNFITGDMGNSFKYNKPVVDVVAGRMINTFILAFPAITLGYIFGSIFGTIIGSNRGSWLERFGVFPLFVFGTLPSFFLAIVAVIIFSVKLGWFPTSGMTPPSFSLPPDAAWWRIYTTKQFLIHYILPFTVVFLRYSFLPVLIMRTSVVETMGQNFIYYQRIAGLPKRVRLRQIMKHSILPVLTMYPLTMTQAIGGLVLIEIVFNWPGIGFELVQSVQAQDFPLIQFVFFVIAAAVVILNGVVDILYGVIDPRVSTGD